MCLQAREVRVARDADNAATGTVTLVRRDPFAGVASVPWPNRDAAALSLWEPIPVGVDELGETVHGVAAGAQRAGGRRARGGQERGALAAGGDGGARPGARLWLLDGKLVELAVWAPCAQRLAGPDVDEAIALLRELREEMEARYRELLARGQRKVAPRGRAAAAPGGVRRAGVLPRRPRTARSRREFAELLRDLVARGRAAGVIVLRRDAEARRRTSCRRALRDLFGFRLALRCNTPQASDTILGQGWATLGPQRGDDRARAARRRAAAGRGRHAGPDARVPPDRRRRRRAGRARRGLRAMTGSTRASKADDAA